MNGIVDSNQLNPSLKAANPKDARYGNGQYLSDILPDELSAQLKQNHIASYTMVMQMLQH